jgi:hypothetical protein
MPDHIIELDDNANHPHFVVAAGNDDISSSQESAEDESARWVCFPADVVHSNEDDGLSGGVVLLDANTVALAIFGIVKLQALVLSSA